MTRRLTTDQAVRAHNAAAAAIKRSLARAPEMVRRGQFAASDGFPSSSMGGNGSASDVSRPTEQAALAGAGEDRTGDSIARWETLLSEIHERALLLDGISADVMSIEADERGRQSTLAECDCCGRAVTNVGEDRIKGAGLCPTCHRDWCRWSARSSDPNVAAFIRERRAKLETRAS